MRTIGYTKFNNIYTKDKQIPSMNNKGTFDSSNNLFEENNLYHSIVSPFDSKRT